MNDKKQHNLKILTWIFIVIFPPIGIFLLFKAYPDMVKNKRNKIIAGALIWFVIALILGSVQNHIADNASSTPAIVESTTSSQPKSEAETTLPILTTTETEPGSEITKETTETATKITDVPKDITEAPSSQPASVQSKTVTENTNSQSTEKTYALNASTHKYHKTTCSELKKIKENNLSYYTGTANELIQQGYSACKKCNPS